MELVKKKMQQKRTAFEILRNVTSHRVVNSLFLLQRSTFCLCTEMAITTNTKWLLLNFDFPHTIIILYITI